MQIIRIDITNAHLVNVLFNQYRMFYKQPSDIELAENFICERLENNESVIFLAMADDGTPAGFTQLYPALSSVRAIKNWILNDLFVDASHRKQGIGEALIKAATDFAKSQKAQYLQLETAADNHIAQSLYENIGFIKQPADSTFFVYRITILPLGG
jgi:ribosomal protein S18 acetylase RimI-like enzyme